MVQFTGHGTTQWWTKETIWQVADVPLLTNTTMLPVIMSFNCLDGYFIYPTSTYQAIEETMLRPATAARSPRSRPAARA